MGVFSSALGPTILPALLINSVQQHSTTSALRVCVRACAWILSMTRDHLVRLFFFLLHKKQATGFDTGVNHPFQTPAHLDGRGENAFLSRNMLPNPFPQQPPRRKMGLEAA